MKLSKKAFTLIELLVVIAIISLLLAVIVPSLKAVKQQASAAICASNAKQIVTAWFNYAEANKSFICSADTQNAAKDFYDWIDRDNGTTVESEIDAIRRGTLFPFYENPELVHCPMDIRHRKPAKSGSRPFGAYRTYSFLCTLNSSLVTNNPTDEAWLIANAGISKKDLVKKFPNIKSPGTKYILVEENDPRGVNLNSWVMKLKDPSGMIDPFAVFHNMRSILGFADGHAVIQRWQDDRTEKFSKEVGENTHSGGFSSRTDEETNPLNQDFRWLADRFARSR